MHHRTTAQYLLTTSHCQQTPSQTHRSNLQSTSLSVILPWRTSHHVTTMYNLLQHHTRCYITDCNHQLGFIKIIYYSQATWHWTDCPTQLTATHLTVWRHWLAALQILSRLQCKQIPSLCTGHFLNFCRNVTYGQTC